MQVQIDAGFLDERQSGTTISFAVIVAFTWAGQTHFVFESPDAPDQVGGNCPGLYIVSEGSTFFLQVY